MSGAGPPMEVRVRLFAMLRERAGTATLEVELPHGATVADAMRLLGEREELAELLERMPLRAAVNREYAGIDTVLHAGDELALIPPVSGGEQPRETVVHARVTGEPLSAERLSRAVASPRAGALVVFQGVTRELPALDYEAYTEMAAERIEVILSDCVARHALTGAAAEHRVGRVELGEPSVIVAVSAAHREEAFAGAREAIDRIKREAPIWKREEGRDGAARWVEGAVPPIGGGEGAPEADGA